MRGITQGGFVHIMNYGIINHWSALLHPPPLHTQTAKIAGASIFYCVTSNNFRRISIPRLSAQKLCKYFCIQMFLCSSCSFTYRCTLHKHTPANYLRTLVQILWIHFLMKVLFLISIILPLLQNANSFRDKKLHVWL